MLATSSDISISYINNYEYIVLNSPR